VVAVAEPPSYWGYFLTIMIGIYKITSPTGKIYIGQSWDIRKRKSGYKNLKCSGQKKLYHSLSYHGWDKHTFEVIHELPSDISQMTLDSYEVLYWNCYIDCNIDMLNLKEPGYGGRHSDETKLLLSKISKGRKHSDEAKAKMSKTRTGHIVTDKTKNKISDAAKGHKRSLGKKHTEESKKKMTQSQMGNQKGLGHKKSDEVKKRISEAQKGNKTWLGRKHTEETKKKLSEIRKNMTEETREKMREAAKKREEVKRLKRLNNN
jgi:group I intron endonuclease